ncbi:hypothetical protein M3B46_03920 [Sphingobacterium daejeonense]|uniref:hypothetical protein n=1 Tax=Sphingobacterium daejeonense TaxID=371142 RepID=UPI0021A45E45|nr:hypothetical protein [Sphingobacterium daejeonense]MCT1530126.1 hypothetical protein [Sphingobacterium daejeonense]
MLLGNSAQIEITPSLGTIINGEFNSRYANKIADPLFAKAIYLKNENTKILFIVVDICVMKRDFLDPIKTKIHDLTGISPSNQLISSTHTHSAGSVADLLLGHVDLAYREFLEKKLITLASEVCNKENQLKIAFSKIEKPEHLTCRRYIMDSTYLPKNPVLKSIDVVKTNPFGAEDLIVKRTTTPDPEVCFFGLKTMDDRWIGLLANYGLHYVGDCDRGTVTADYFGYFSNKIKKLLNSENMIAIMTNGTSGEVNIWDFINGDRYPKENHQKSRLIGEDIAQSIFEVINNLSWDTNPKIQVLYSEIKINKRSLPESILTESYNILSKTDYESLTYMDNDLMEKVYAREQVLLESVQNVIDFPIQCFKIGKTIISGLGGEFFSETGVKLKQDNPQSFTICLANDYVGYVPPVHEFKNGGYETWRCRSSFLEEIAEEKVKTELFQLINSLKNGKD